MERDDTMQLTADLIADAVVTASANRLLLIALIGFLQGDLLPDLDPLREELPAGVSPELAEADPVAADMISRAIIDAHEVLDGLDDDGGEEGDRLVHLAPDKPAPANDR